MIENTDNKINITDNKINSLGKIIVSLSKVKHVKDLTFSQRNILNNLAIGGVILFADNLDKKSELSQIRNLITDLKKLNPELIFAIDHEGGLIFRFNQIFRPPAAKFFGNLYNSDKSNACNQCERAAYLVGKDLKNLGVDWCFSPVADIHYDKSQIIGEKLRAFSEDKNAIVDLSISWLKGLNKAGIKGCLKHFPGHGRCELDSHVDYPEDNQDFLSWQNDLNIYKNIFTKANSDNLNLDYLVMLGHMRVPNLYQDLTKSTESTEFSNKIFSQSEYESKPSQGFIKSNDKISFQAEPESKSPQGFIKSKNKTFSQAESESKSLQDLTKSTNKTSFQAESESPVYSSLIIKKLLKQELKYTGLVISDCLSMQAADAKANLADKIKAAHNAGCDWVIAANVPLEGVF